MDEYHKNAYRYVIYQAMVDVRGLQYFPGRVQWLDPRHWRRLLRRVHGAGALAEWLHNLAWFSCGDFRNFDEERFWQQYESYRHRFSLDSGFNYRDVFERQLKRLYAGEVGPHNPDAAMDAVQHKATPISPPITTETLPDALQRHRAIVLRFWVTWDISGRQVDTWLQEVSPEFDGCLAFYSVDADAEADGLTARYGIQTTPTLVLLLNGDETVRRVHIRSRKELVLTLHEWREAAETAAKQQG